MPSVTARPSDSPGDVIVVMQGAFKEFADQDIQIRTVRRHYPWIYTEDVDGKGWRRLRFMNEVGRFSFKEERRLLKFGLEHASVEVAAARLKRPVATIERKARKMSIILLSCNRPKKRV